MSCSWFDGVFDGGFDDLVGFFFFGGGFDGRGTRRDVEILFGAVFDGFLRFFLTAVLIRRFDDFCITQ